MIPLLAAIRSATPAPGAAPSPPPVEIRDLPALEKLPAWATWQIVLAAILLLALLALLGWWLARVLSRRLAAPPPTPRQSALEALARLREQVRTLDAYRFSIAVSGVLRTFMEAQYHLPVQQQTSSEFLAAIARDATFSAADRVLLADFLERCDLIQFARAEADVTASEELLGSATAFVQGGPAL